MSLNFSKMHGLGNDFVVLDGTRTAIDMPPARARAIADRRFGIGCDQILIVDAQQSPGVFGYRIVNADGSEVGQCGNGVRCVARFVRERGLSDAQTLGFATATARMQVSFAGDQVCVDMGQPRFDPVGVPFLPALATAADSGWYSVTVPAAAAAPETSTMETASTETVRFGVVSMGNPHAVVQVPAVQGAAVDRIGTAVEHHPAFPQRVNVGFAQVESAGHVRLRVWERGAGETLACGSGACAAVAVLRRANLVDSQVTVSLPGGDLLIAWAGEGAALKMTGPAETVFTGETDL